MIAFVVTTAANCHGVFGAADVNFTVSVRYSKAVGEITSIAIRCCQVEAVSRLLSEI